MHELRTLSAAFVAVLALSVVGASTALAEGVYRASSVPATGTSTSSLGNDKFTTEAGALECKVASSATQNVPNTASLTVQSTYTSCNWFGFAPVIDMMSCDYLFTTPETNGGVHLWKAKVHVKCATPGDAITTTAGPCKVSIGEQSPGGHVIITNTTHPAPTPDDIDTQKTLTGINYTVTQDGFLCPFNGTGAKTGATYTQVNEVTFHVPGIDISVGHP